MNDRSTSASASVTSPSTSTNAAASALRFENVSFSYGRPRKRSGIGSGEKPGAAASNHTAPLIDGLSLNVPAHELTVLLGSNGCGKSTLLRLADGLLVPQAGDVTLQPAITACVAHTSKGPVRLAELSARSRARAIALLPQIHRTPSMTVEQLVMCGRYAHMGPFARPTAADRRAVASALEEVGIAGLAHHPARHLSGGQRQTAFLAMALAQQAPILLLDEPTTYLDPRAALDLMGLLRRLVRDRRLTVLAVMHDLDLALRCADRAAVMDAGAILDTGTPGELLQRGTIRQALAVDAYRADMPQGAAYVFFPAKER